MGHPTHMNPMDEKEALENPRDHNPPAFPVILPPEFDYAADGMTLRDYFAGQALVGIISSREWVNHAERESPENLSAHFAYAIADAMLAERSKDQEGG